LGVDPGIESEENPAADKTKNRIDVKTSIRMVVF
jgi:hypothetical protein